MNRLHPLSAVTNALQRGGIGLSVPFFVSTLASVFEFVDVGWALVLAPVGFVLGSAYGVAYYYRFAYELTADTFDVASGVLSRRTREIPYRRIQNVDVEQGVVYRLLGIAVVNVETAGGGDTEAVLDFVGESEAKRLQRSIRQRTAESAASRRASSTAAGDDQPAGAVVDETAAEQTTGDAEPTAHRPTLLFELAPRELLLYSLASVRPAAAAGVLFLAFFASGPILDALVATAQPFGGPATLESGSIRSYAILSAVSFAQGVVATYLLGAVYTFFAYYGFRLGRAGEDLVYERGLLQNYSGSIPLEKVQTVTITDNPLQRAIGYAGLWVETAGYGPDSGSGSQSAVPLARARRIYRFAERFSGLEKPTFERPTAVARRRYLGRYAIVAGVVVAAAFVVSLVTPIERWYLAAVVFLAVPPAAHLRWVNLGYAVADEHVAIRAGFWRRRTTVVPYYRIQTISTRRSIFQRRLGLASLVVDTASSRTFARSDPTIYDVDLEVAREIHDASRERLQSALRDRTSSDDGGVSVAFT
ncbi:PH domain-containing protein [Natribaculum luteum]|uniref:PH domain-containing protein n=1 Tax=Natribaculum luteum TaxID=1586232 RepID=A0ABD5NVV3_9EURY|nr:PH domain-containing protein [Natribaculum luteum]